MSEAPIKTRSEIDEKYTWNATSVFPTPQAFDEEADRLGQDLSGLEAYQANLTQSPARLLAGMQLFEELLKRAGKIYVYASLSHEVDKANPDAARRLGQAMDLFGRLTAAGSFIDPALLSLGREVLQRWMAEEPRLKVYAHYVDNLDRKQAHIRSAEVEELLGMLTSPFTGTGSTASILTDADFRFPPAQSSTGQEIPVSQGSILGIMNSSDREARRSAWESYTDTYLAYQNTLASNLSTSIQQNVFQTRARRYPSTLEGSLFENNIPVEVFYNLVETYRRHLPVWHRYWRARRKALKLETLHPYDIWAPLSGELKPISYEQAVDWICEGLSPLGEEYVQVLRKGCLEDRWIDVFPNQGKSSAQFSSGWPGTHPFIFTNYNQTIFSVSTIAHELGHSMHSYLAWQNQPVIYSNYSLFVAEVASNFNQAMLRAYLLDTNPDPAFQLSVIEEAMGNFHRYFFVMPTLARFELDIHQRAERGQGISAADMNSLMADLFAEGYGEEVQVDRDRVGITWATFGHLYADYYVYQYATGISGAHALSRPILDGQPGAAERYLGFLKAGGSVYPIDALKQAGVDLSTPQPVEETFAVLEGLVARLETLVG